MKKFNIVGCVLLVASMLAIPLADVASAATVPGPPTGLVGTRGNSSVSVAFVPPLNDGGSVIISYQVTCPSSNGGATGSASGAASPIVVAGLTNGKTYTCTATATNGIGRSAPSAASNSFVPSPVAPGPPTVLVGTRRNGSVSVAFVAPADNGGSAVTSYLVTCPSSDGGATGSASGGGSPIVVGGLTNGNTYTCTATATNAFGTSVASAVSNSFVPSPLPGPPTGLVGTPGNGSVSVAFVAPVNDGGSAVTSYLVTCSSSDGGATGSASGSGSPIVLSGLTNGNMYTCTATATNAFGPSGPSAASNSFVAASVPGPPTGLVGTRSNGSGSVAFVAPVDNGGSAVTSYLVTCPSSDGGATGSASGSGSPIVVAGLTNGKTYTCTATATNGVGTSAPSAASNSFAPAPVISGPPSGLVGTRSNGSASVAFVAPVDNGGSAITSYLVTCTSSDGGATGSASGSGSPIVVGALTNGNTYTCTATATNGVGTSAPSTVSNSFVVSPLPGPPTGLVGTRGNSSASVAFVAPANNGGSAVTSYLVTCPSSDGGATGSAPGAGSPIVVTGLTNGNTYTCTATAANAFGPSAPSAVSNSFLVATLPGPPTGLVATQGNGSASVAFVAPANNGGSAVTSYRVTCPSSDGGVTGSASGAASPIVVSGLTNGNTYTCSATATNAPGTSAPSAGSNTFVPSPVAPGPPTGLVAKRGNALVSVAFAAPFDNGGSAVTSYLVTCSSSDGGAPGSASGAVSPIVVSGLTNGNTYTCTATATNGAGTSVVSALSNSLVVSPLPGPPTGPVGTRGNGSASVAFVAPVDNGGSAITSYLVTCTSSDGGAPGSASGAGNPIVVGALTNGNTYTCIVTANNAFGPGAPSAVSNSFLVAAVSGVPTGLVGTRGNGSVSVSFAAPANDGGSPIASYDVSCVSSTGGAPGSASGSGSPIVVSGLTNGSTYTCSATATNGAGTSASSAASNSFLVATVPDPPTGLVGTRGTASVSVAFVAPAVTGGSAVTNYEVTCPSSDGGATGSASGSGSPIVVSGLTNDSTYTCNATATNGVGISAPSADSNTFVPSMPRLSVGDRSMFEGDSGIAKMIFPVTLSRPSKSPVTVHYSATGVSAIGGAQPGNGVDFRSKSNGTVTFTPGSTSRFIVVAVFGDTVAEPDDTFAVTLSKPPTGFLLGRSAATGTILNDDDGTLAAKLSVGDTSIVNGDLSHQSLRFEVTLSAKTTAVSIGYTLTPGSATFSSSAAGGGDYGGKTSGTLSFAAGSMVQIINVPIWPDANPDTDQAFTITLSGLNGTGAKLIHATATGTILSLS